MTVRNNSRRKIEIELEKIKHTKKEEAENTSNNVINLGKCLSSALASINLLI